MNKKEAQKTLHSLRGTINRDYYILTNEYSQPLYDVIKWIKQLDEPTVPVIPQWFADWIENNRCDDKGLQVYMLWVGYENDRFTGEQDTWIKSNMEFATRAILDGYEVEKEQLYYIEIIGDGIGYINKHKTEGYIMVSGKNETESWMTMFTEAEIKDIDPRYMAFAVKVEE